MIIHTHFEPINGNDSLSLDYMKLLDVWKRSWEMRGFTCIITGKDFISSRMNNEIVKKFCDKVESFPSVNFKGFDRACFMRWIAAYIISSEFNQPICTAEPDVINYSLSVADVMTLSPNKFNIADRDGCPTFTYTSTLLLETFITMITNHTITVKDRFDNKPHLSDQDFIDRYCISLEWYNSTSYLIGSVFRTPNWKNMKMVHYGTPFFIEKGLDVRTKSKATSILELRAI